MCFTKVLKFRQLPCKNFTPSKVLCKIMFARNISRKYLHFSNVFHFLAWYLLLRYEIFHWALWFWAVSQNNFTTLWNAKFQVCWQNRNAENGRAWIKWWQQVFFVFQNDQWQPNFRTFVTSNPFPSYVFLCKGCKLAFCLLVTDFLFKILLTCLEVVFPRADAHFVVVGKWKKNYKKLPTTCTSKAVHNFGHGILHGHKLNEFLFHTLVQPIKYKWKFHLIKKLFWHN